MAEGIRPRDEAYRTHGQDHQNKLKELADKIESSLDEDEIFSDQAQEKIEHFISENIGRLGDIVERIYSSYLALGSSQAPGHESAHILDNLNSALEAIGQSELSEGQKLEIVFACFGHDLGRYVEAQMPEVAKHQSGLLMPMVLGRKLLAQEGFPEEFGQRVLYDIMTGSKADTGHLTAEIVHQADRESVVGSAIIARDLAFGMTIEDYDMDLPNDNELSQIEGYERSLPNPYVTNIPWKFFHFEFMMRNLYPPATESGESNYDRNRLETAVILMLATRDRPEMYKVIFAPEEGLVETQDLSKTKRSLDPQIFELAKKEYQEFLDKADRSEYKPGEELEVAKSAMKIEKIEIPDNFDQFFGQKMESYSEEERKNLYFIILYTIQCRHNKRIIDLNNLGRYEGVIESTVAKKVGAELEDRETLYNQVFSDGVLKEQ